MPKQKEPGLPPGTLVYVGKKKVQKVSIDVIDYTESKFEEKAIKRVEDCVPFKDKPSITWINVNGIHDINIIQKIGDGFGLHPLILEDVVTTDQRPKSDDYDKYLFIVLKMVYYSPGKDKLNNCRTFL